MKLWINRKIVHQPQTTDIQSSLLFEGRISMLNRTTPTTVKSDLQKSQVIFNTANHISTSLSILYVLLP